MTPYLVVDAASVRHEAATEPVLARLVAEVDGAVVGIARLRMRRSRAMLMVQVLPGHRRRGVGGALLTAALPLVPSDADEVAGVMSGDDASQAAVQAWGFDLGRRHTISAVDPRTVRPGSGAVPLDAVEPSAVHTCYAATADDDPSGLSQAPPYDVFVGRDWHSPTHRADLGRAVLEEDGRVAAFAMVTVAGQRAWCFFTGTRPDRRGEGLALRVKAASLTALARAGLTSCGTGNDAGNHAMLVVNDRLGFRPVAWTASVSRQT